MNSLETQKMTFWILQILAICFAQERGSLERGVFFHEETKILLAEKFINVQFVVPPIQNLTYN